MCIRDSARPILYGLDHLTTATGTGNRVADATDLLHRAAENHVWRQKQCINLIPSENTPSRAVQLLCASDPAFRYAEHKKIKSFYDKDVFYYQGTEFIDRVEQLLVEQMRQYPVSYTHLGMAIRLHLRRAKTALFGASSWPDPFA